MSAQAIKSWEVKPSSGGHLGVLDGMRGIAILMVVFFHTIYTNPQGGAVSRVVGLVFNTGGMGVPIFFVLSGFLIAHPFFRQREKDRQSWYVKGYVRRRIGKIIPPFYLSIVIFAVYYYIRFSNPAYWLVGLQWAVGVANFIPSVVNFHASYWSLVIEAHFYILLPLLFLLFKGRASRPVSYFIFVILFFVPLFARQFTWPAAEVPRDQLGFLMNRFPCSLDFFAWGVLFAGFFTTRPITAGNAAGLRYLGYAGMFFLLFTIGLNVACAMRFDVNFHPQRWSVELFRFLTGLSAFLLLFFVFDPNCWGSRFFALAPLRFIGIVSYEWFLFHQPIVTLFKELIVSTHGNVLLYLVKTILPLALTFGFSVIVYRYFSFPLLKWCRGDRSKKDDPKSVGSAETVPANATLPVASAKSVEQL